MGRENLKRKIENNIKGITLVALVVTIIALLILGGVSIGLIFDSNGLFSKANDAGTRFNEANQNELDYLAVVMNDLDKYNGTDGEDSATETITTSPFETLTPTPTLIPPQQNTGDGAMKYINLTTNLAYINTRNVYGADVLGYECDREDIEWQIFYIDETDNNRVYLIAKDYVVPPVSKATPTPYVGGNESYPKAYRFGKTSSDTSILGKYKGVIPKTEFTQKFLSDYVENSASTQLNLQATNYMLDQTIWREYLNRTKADYAFGGPTLPLFQASYNDICSTETKLEIRKNGTGYQVRKGTDSFTNNVDGLGDTITQKGIYFKGNRSDSAYGMWLASPSSAANVSMIPAMDFGIVSYDGISQTKVGFRPIVRLNSNIQFTANENGSYTIN